MVKALAKKITLVEGAHNWWKWFSTWCFASIAGIGGALALLPTDTLSGHIPFTVATTWRELGIAVIIFNAFIGPMVTAIRQNPPPSLKELGVDFDPTQPGDSAEDPPTQEEIAQTEYARTFVDMTGTAVPPNEPANVIHLQMPARPELQYVPYVAPEAPAAGYSRTDCDHAVCPHPGVCQPAGRCVRPA